MAETIDSHHHLWRYTAQDYGWIAPHMGVLQHDFLPDKLEREIRLAGVDGTVAVQARQSLSETRWLLECAETSSAIRGVVGWLPLTDGDVKAAVHKLGAPKKLKGLRHVIQDEPDDDFILRDDFNAGISSMLGTGLVYDVLIHERHLPQTVKFVRRHPEQAFVLDHVAKPKIVAHELEPWRRGLLELAEAGNVSCKLSGMVTEADWKQWTLDDLRPYLDAAVEAFGPERLMVGSDWPVCLLASEYSQWWETVREWCSQFNDADKEALLGGTAKRVYHLG